MTKTKKDSRNGGRCSPLPSLTCSAWPDRPGFWWVRHRWGMELVESYAVDADEYEDPESPFAVITHNGGGASEGPFMPSDLEKEAVFAWLGESFPQNVEHRCAAKPARQGDENQ